MIRGKVSVRWNDDDDVGMIKKSALTHGKCCSLSHTRAHMAQHSTVCVVQAHHILNTYKFSK